MKIFRSTGFDTVIGKGTIIAGAKFELNPGTTLIEGFVSMETITSPAGSKLMINGNVEAGDISVDELIVNGTLKAVNVKAKIIAANKTAQIDALTMTYEKPIFQPGAKVNIVSGFKHISSTTAEQP